MSAHAEFLRVAAEDEALAARVKRDFRKAGLPPHEHALLEFVETLTLAPWEIGGADWNRLRGHGWKDVEIAHAVLGSAHFNYLNRMADGTGIRFEYSTAIETYPVPLAERAPPRESTTGRDDAGFPRPDPVAAAAIVQDLPSGEPAALFAAISVNPEAARGAAAWRRYHLRGSERFGERDRIRIALYVAGLDRCPAAVEWLRGAADRSGIAAAEVATLAEGEVPAGTGAFDRFLFEHARRLTQSPWLAAQEHVDRMRAEGWTDRDVLRFTMLVAYLSFEHRAALGLGA